MMIRIDQGDWSGWSRLIRKINLDHPDQDWSGWSRLIRMIKIDQDDQDWSGWSSHHVELVRTLNHVNNSFSCFKRQQLFQRQIEQNRERCSRCRVFDKLRNSSVYTQSKNSLYHLSTQHTVWTHKNSDQDIIISEYYKVTDGTISNVCIGSNKRINWKRASMEARLAFIIFNNGL